MDTLFARYRYTMATFRHPFLYPGETLISASILAFLPSAAATMGVDIGLVYGDAATFFGFF